MRMAARTRHPVGAWAVLALVGFSLLAHASAAGGETPADGPERIEHLDQIEDLEHLKQSVIANPVSRTRTSVGARPTPTSSAPSSTSSTSFSASTTTSLYQLPLQVPIPSIAPSPGEVVQLNDSVPVQTTLQLVAETDSDSDSSLSNSQGNALFFALDPPSSAGQVPEAYVTLSACSGPEIYLDKGDTGNIDDTFLRLVLSTDAGTAMPSPGGSKSSTYTALNGFAFHRFSAGSASSGLSIGVYPPKNTKGQMGEMTIEVTASYVRSPMTLFYGNMTPVTPMESVYTLELDDTDMTTAMISAAPRQHMIGDAPPAGIMLSRTSDAPTKYFNSSACAIRTAFLDFYDALPPAGKNIVTKNVSDRSIPRGYGAQRTQWTIEPLEPNTNYTAWLTTDSQWPPEQANLQYGPAIKFKTKHNPNCQLVSNLGFCPEVAYATAVGPHFQLGSALHNIEETVEGVMSNFSKAVSTFSCGTGQGRYSHIATCDDCVAAYRRWVCAMAIPRCADTPPGWPQTNWSGQGSGGAFPYTVVRQGANRLNASFGFTGPFGELLPCLDICHMVAINCPPVVQWVCPSWDITAQSDYGTFADASRTLGYVEHDLTGEGAGKDGQLWGGLRNYVATDDFGNSYCNPLGVDAFLREYITNAPANIASSHARPHFVVILPLFLITLFATAL